MVEHELDGLSEALEAVTIDDAVEGLERDSTGADLRDRVSGEVLGRTRVHEHGAPEVLVQLTAAVDANARVDCALLPDVVGVGGEQPGAADVHVVGLDHRVADQLPLEEPRDDHCDVVLVRAGVVGVVREEHVTRFEDIRPAGLCHRGLGAVAKSAEEDRQALHLRE